MGREGGQAEAGTQEVGRKREEGGGDTSSAGRLGLPEVSSALSAEAPPLGGAANPLPSPSQAALWLTASCHHPVPGTLGLGICRACTSAKPASAYHFLHPGPGAGHSQDLSLPDSTAYDWLALGPP